MSFNIYIFKKVKMYLYFYLKIKRTEPIMKLP